MKRYIIHITLSVLAFVSCTDRSGWTKEEIGLISAPGTLMRVLTVDSPADSAVLRTECLDLGPGMVASEEFRMLEAKMKATVTSPDNDGVGIAGPQVGICRRVVVVQRLDKEDFPFEIYPDIVIAEKRGENVSGDEGCLSVPNMYGTVSRSRDITINYLSPLTLRDTSEVVTGFTAVIFQHETDHLDGILYTDYLK